KSDYEPIGVVEKFSDLDVYVSKPKDKTKPFKNAIIICYDIHGFHPNVKQFCDLLAEAGFLVVLPDYFHGETAEAAAKGVQELVDYILKNYPNERIEKETLKVIEYLRSEYGVKNLEVLKDSQYPIAFLPSHDDLDPVNKPFIEKCLQKRFNDMPHGFAGTRSDFHDELNSKRANEVIEISVKFFYDNLGVKYYNS
ncbi:hypothetical protein C1645_839018, partial [Glomus cerebriforme]